MTWNTTNATNMRANRAKGIYFTLDQNDLGLNVDAYSFLLSIPNPYTDLEDDSGHDARDEAEVVSESTSFPCNGVYVQRIRVLVALAPVGQHMGI